MNTEQTKVKCDTYYGMVSTLLQDGLYPSLLYTSPTGKPLFSVTLDTKGNFTGIGQQLDASALSRFLRS